MATFVALRDSSRLDGADLRERAERDGYVFVRGLLDAELVLALRRRVLDMCRGRGWIVDGSDGIASEGVRLGACDDDWVSMQQEVALLPEFRALGRDEAIVRVLETIFDGPVRGGVGAVCRVTSPAAPDLATPPHQDHHFIRRTDAFWTVWIPLGDCPQSLGGLAVLPGSHRIGLQVHGEGDTVDVPNDAVWATADFACGDALLFHCLTLHRACLNVTRNRVRVSADYRYQPVAALSQPKLGASST